MSNDSKQTFDKNSQTKNSQSDRKRTGSKENKLYSKRDPTVIRFLSVRPGPGIPMSTEHRDKGVSNIRRNSLTNFTSHLTETESH